MTFVITSTSPTPQPAQSGKGGVAASGNISSEAFRSLFATLMALTAPGTEATPDTKIEGQTAQPGKDGLAAFEARLASLDLALQSVEETAAPGESELLEGEELITNLLDALKALGTAFENGDAIDGELVDNATKALDALISLTETIANPAVPGQGGTPAPTTDPLAGIDAKGATAQQTPVAAGAPVPAETTPKSTNPTTGLERAAERLADLSQRFAEKFPELSGKLDQLAERLTQLQASSKNNPGTPGITPTDSADGDANLINRLAALFGSREAGKPVTPDDVLAPKTKGEAPRIHLQAASGDRPDTRDPLTNPVTPKHTAGEAEADPRGGKTTANAAALAASAAQSGAAKSDVSVQPVQDSLLAVQGAQPGSRADFAAMIKPAAAAYGQPGQNLNIPHVAFEMARQFRAGGTRFEIRLNPPEMGKIDVRMDIDRSGTLNARLTVERAETLDLLQRDARVLERALSQAGLDHGRTNLEFSLKQNPFARQDGFTGDQNGQNGKFSLADADSDMSNLADEVAAITHYRGYATPGGVNMLA